MATTHPPAKDPLPKSDQCVKGINWGQYNLDDKHLSLKHNSQTLLSLPLGKIQNTSVLSKNEVVLEVPFEEFKEEDDQLCEIRFYMPPTLENKESEKEKKDNADGEADGNMETENVQTLAEIFNQELVNKAKMGQFSSDSIVTFPEIPLVVPRGKYVADIYKNFLRFHGMTFNYRIEFKAIEKAFLLPKPDDVHMVFVLALKSPLRQGNTSYPYIVMQFKKDFEQEIKIRLKPEQIKEYGEALKEEYSGPLYDTVTKIFKILVGVNIIIPGNFKSSTNHSGLRCSLRAHEGFLFPLQKSLIFINKPIVYMRLDEIAVAEFHRIASATNSTLKCFDLEIKRKDRNASQTFVGIDKTELDLLMNYFRGKTVKVQIVDDKMANKFDEDDYDDEDEMEEEGKGKGRSKKSNPNQKKIIKDDYLDDDDEEDDESFKAEDEEEESDEDDDDAEEQDNEDFQESQKKKLKK